MLLLGCLMGWSASPAAATPSFAQQAYLKASNPAAGDRLGVSVGVSGDTVVVGAIWEDSNATGVNGNQSNNSLPDSGAAYVYVRNGSTWTQQAYLKASNPGAGDSFGQAIAISGDTVVVGVEREDSLATGINGNQADNSGPDAGAVYVFRRTGTNWVQEAYLKASNTDAYDQFGHAVAISGNTIVVGANYESSAFPGISGDNSAPRAGAAYVFTRSGSNWSQQAYLKASNTSAEDRFGESVAISGDRVVVGAWFEDSSATGVNGIQLDDSSPQSGAAYVFTRSGSNWTQEAYLKAHNTGPDDLFGYSVAISGGTVVVGAFSEDGSGTGVNPASDNSAPGSGAAYVFADNGGGSWSQSAYLKASNTGPDDRFGWSVAVSGTNLAVGAMWEAGSGQDVNPPSDEAAGKAGAAYVFTLGGSNWTQLAYVKAFNPSPDDQFAYALSLSGDLFVATSFLESGSGSGVNPPGDNDLLASGAAYVYDFTARPEMAVLNPAGANLPDGGAQDWGEVLSGTNASLTFTVTNSGACNLTGLTLLTNGTHAADFAVTTPPIAPVFAGGTTTFTVRFTPSSIGARSAALHLASNDDDESPFDLTVTGRGFVWGTDSDGDGLADIAETYFGTSPVQGNAEPWTLLTGTNSLLLRWPEAVPAGITVIPQWSPDLLVWLTNGQSATGIAARALTVSSPTAGVREVTLSTTNLDRAHLRLKFSTE